MSCPMAPIVKSRCGDAATTKPQSYRGQSCWSTRFTDRYKCHGARARERAFAQTIGGETRSSRAPRHCSVYGPGGRRSRVRALERCQPPTDEEPVPARAVLVEEQHLL